MLVGRGGYILANIGENVASGLPKIGKIASSFLADTLQTAVFCENAKCPKKLRFLPKEGPLPSHNKKQDGVVFVVRDGVAGLGAGPGHPLAARAIPF